ncbi:MAG: DUF1848 domain-containing protein [Clostridia bacterium]|nr:DUF1848 domain-containing protein [Clostridia bacterium]
MILSVSRRTDIPAFYAPWFIRRLEEGYVLVRNPMNYHQVSRVSLAPDVIDCIVFWSKNPAPLLRHLEYIGSRYPFYFQYTLNAYEKEIEPGLVPLSERIDTFRQLSRAIGPDRVIWRYDPIFISPKYNAQWHAEQFRNLVKALAKYTDTCVISFVDLYEKVKKTASCFGISECSEEEMNKLASAISIAAKEAGIQVKTCAEKIDLQKYGITHNCCIDAELISRITGWKLKVKKDPNQRAECGCIESIDIGQYNTCKHGCKYCYATFNPHSVETFSKRHLPESSLLIGELESEDKITDRKMKSLKDHVSGQISLFDM